MAERHATTSITHITIQEALDGKMVEWMERVSDEQYLGRADADQKHVQ